MSSPNAFYYIAKSELCVGSADRPIGDGVFAGCDYSVGQTVCLATKPLAAAIDNDRVRDTCSTCYKFATALQRCAGCKRKRYCTKHCQKESWSSGHKQECKLLQKIDPERELPRGVSVVMEILIRRKHGLISDESWNALCSLQPHIEDYKRNGTFGDIELMATGALNFSGTMDKFNLELVVAMYGRVLSNALTLTTPTLEPSGLVVDPTLCKFNHSCEPNAYVIMDGPSISIRALQPIKKDEEMYISYIDTTYPCGRRQSELRKRWFFACSCNKCQKGPTLMEDKWAIEPQQISAKTKELIDLLLKEGVDPTQSEDFVGDSVDEKRAAALQAYAFNIYEKHQSPQPDRSQAIKDIENVMQKCHDSGLFPLYRQPYAALRDELILKFLAAKQYEKAWFHMTKRYKHILPVLYPQKFHPIRVVQTWQTASLALYLAGQDDGDSEPIAPNADMGIIAFVLVSEVVEAAKISHGTENSFTKKAVWTREGMIEDMKMMVGDGWEAMIGQDFKVQKDVLLGMGDTAAF